MLTYFNIVISSLLIFRTCKTFRSFQSSRPLLQEDYDLGKSLNVSTDLVDLYPGKGGPMNFPSTESSNVSKGVWAIWPKGRIPYWLDPSFSELDRATIANAFLYIEDLTCLRFIPDTDDKNPRMDIISDNLGNKHLK